MGHQTNIYAFEAIRRSYWCPKLCQDIVKYISWCDICTKTYKIWQNTYKST